MQFEMRSPCANCPFRKDKLFPLHPKRVTEILTAILVEGKTFACHKTTKLSWVEDDNGEITYAAQMEEQHCAGALILIEKTQTSNQMLRIAERLRLYDYTKLDMSAAVFATAKEMKTQLKKYWETL